MIEQKQTSCKFITLLIYVQCNYIIYILNRIAFVNVGNFKKDNGTIKSTLKSNKSNTIKPTIKHLIVNNQGRTLQVSVFYIN